MGVVRRDLWERWFRSLGALGPVWGGQVCCGEFAKGRHQRAVVSGAAGQHDVAGFDAFEGDGGEVGSQALVTIDGDGDRLSGGDEFQPILEGVEGWAVVC